MLRRNAARTNTYPHGQRDEFREGMEHGLIAVTGPVGVERALSHGDP